MSKRKRILLHGSSLVLGGIGASLGGVDEFEVVRLPQSLPNTSDVDAFAPDVVIFDIEAPGSAAAFSALESRPDLLLLGVSSDKNVAWLWSGRQYRELSVTDIAALIGAGFQPIESAPEKVVTTRES